MQLLWQALTDDTITAANGWEAYTVGVKRRHEFVHRATDVPKDEAEQFISAAEQIVAHIAYVMANVSLERPGSS